MCAYSSAAYAHVLMCSTCAPCNYCAVCPIRINGRLSEIISHMLNVSHGGGVPYGTAWPLTLRNHSNFYLPLDVFVDTMDRPQGFIQMFCIAKLCDKWWEIFYLLALVNAKIQLLIPTPLSCGFFLRPLSGRLIQTRRNDWKILQ